MSISYLDLAATLAVFILALQYSINSFLKDLIFGRIKDLSQRSKKTKKYLIRPTQYLVLFSLIAALVLGILGLLGWQYTI